MEAKNNDIAKKKPNLEKIEMGKSKVMDEQPKADVVMNDLSKKPKPEAMVFDMDDTVVAPAKKPPNIGKKPEKKVDEEEKEAPKKGPPALSSSKPATSTGGGGG